MNLHFESNQEYQLQAIQSVVDVFEGQPLNNGDFEFSLSGVQTSLQFSEYGVGNAIRFVAETKSGLRQADMRPQEWQKIHCGYRHFARVR